MRWFQPAYWRDPDRAPFPWLLIAIYAVPVLIILAAIGLAA